MSPAGSQPGAARHLRALCSAASSRAESPRRPACILSAAAASPLRPSAPLPAPSPARADRGGFRPRRWCWGLFGARCPALVPPQVRAAEAGRAAPRGPAPGRKVPVRSGLWKWAGASPRCSPDLEGCVVVSGLRVAVSSWWTGRGVGVCGGGGDAVEPSVGPLEILRRMPPGSFSANRPQIHPCLSPHNSHL